MTNASIAKALFDLANKKPGDTSLAFVPTAANIEVGDKAWLIEDLSNLRRLGLKSIDIADISALEPRLWKLKMEQADILYFGGGKRYHLMEWIVRSGLARVLPNLLQERVYVGMSGGSMVTSRKLNLRFSHALYKDDLQRAKDAKGLGYVDFSFLPHLNNPYFPNLRGDLIEECTRDMTEIVYALDDSSALKVVDGVVDIVSEGVCKVYKPA